MTLKELFDFCAKSYVLKHMQALFLDYYKAHIRY